MEASFPQVVATALINLSLAWVVGTLAAHVWLTSVSAAWCVPISRALYRALPYALVICTSALLLSLWSEAAVMADVSFAEAGTPFREMLKSTHYGHAGLAALGLSVLALVAHFFLKKQQGSTSYVLAIATCVVLLAAARVSIGHAFEYGALSLATAVELLHILMMALWAGIVFVAGWMTLSIVNALEDGATTDRARFLDCLSHWATMALIAIAATGAYNAYRVLDSPAQLLGSFYGKVLLFKLVMVASAILLGGYNKFVGLPAALSSHSVHDSTHGLKKVIAILRIESMVLFLAVLAAAVLTGSAPPTQAM
jgi:putative copper resistance protein D